MKKKQLHTCISVILISAFFLIIFPFLGMTEFLENLYVLIFAFFIGMSAFRMRAILKGKASDQGINSIITNFFRSLSDQGNEIPHAHKEKKRKLHAMRKKFFKKQEIDVQENELHEEA